MAKATAKKYVAPRPRPTVPVRDVIRWVSEARPDKEIGVGMSFYIVRDGEIRATNGKITASYPWMNDDVFLVSGIEFEKVLNRMGDDDVTIESTNVDSVVVQSDKFTATIGTLPPDVWAYPGIEDAWRPLPGNFIAVLRSLRAFISDNPAQLWAGCVAIEDGNMYATNNIALAGSACAVGNVRTLLSAQAIDFILRRVDGLQSWYANENHIAFMWSTGAWMRVQRVEGSFPERAAGMVREAYDLHPSQVITDEFRSAFADVAGLAEDTIRIFSDRMESKFKKSVVVANAECEVPQDREETYVVGEVEFDAEKGTVKTRTVPGGVSIWGAAFLAPVISQATHWQPSMWPKPAPFRGENVAGFIVGRKSE